MQRYGERVKLSVKRKDVKEMYIGTNFWSAPVVFAGPQLPGRFLPNPAICQVVMSRADAKIRKKALAAKGVGTGGMGCL